MIIHGQKGGTKRRRLMERYNFSTYRIDNILTRLDYYLLLLPLNKYCQQIWLL